MRVSHREPEAPLAMRIADARSVTEVSQFVSGGRDGALWPGSAFTRRRVRASDSLLCPWTQHNPDLAGVKSTGYAGVLDSEGQAILRRRPPIRA